LLFYLLAVVVVLLAGLIAFGGAALLHLQGTAYILFVVIIILLGIGAAITIIVLHIRAKKRQAAEGQIPDGAGAGELDILLDAANNKLRASQQGAKSIDAVPLIYILGDAGSAKTTVVIRSGLDPELLAGAVPQAGETVPTSVLNLWFTRQAALVEVGESIRQSPGLLSRLVARTRAKAYRSAFGTGAAPRGAVVCVSAEQLLLADGGAALLASARSVGGQLREISRMLGAPVPVYVIITKLDRVPHFDEYVRNLSNVEAVQIFGLPLPRTEVSAGLYADQASRTLASALDGICYQLGEFRVEALERELEPANTPGVYEFPREFGKLRKNLNQYLVELCKPSQLSANPYLRGFFFTGIRAQIVERMAAAPAAVEERAPQDAGATQYLNISMGKAPSSRQPQPAMVATRVPQWTFLPRLFPEVILGDKAALTASKQTAPARLFRRILYGTLALLLAVYAVLLLVSFIHNSKIERRIEDAAHQLPSTGPTSTSLPSLTDLQALDQLRQTIVQLDTYNQNGAPLSYRFGLYQGETLAARARSIYFDRFRPTLLNPTQGNFLTYMRSLPDAPATNGDFSLYAAAYNPLKAYLITTTNPEKSQAKFLTPVFLQYWIGSRQVDGEQQQLAKNQVDFYADELLRHPPYTIAADTKVVSKTQSYLSNFLAVTRIYQGMLLDADKTNAGGVDFNKLYPTAASCVVDPHVVRGAFTKPGFTFMQDAMQHPERYANGERWVLGDQPGLVANNASTTGDLKAHYTSDYLQEWHLFMTSARVSCADLHGTVDKLTQLTGPASPLLLLFYTASRNTAVADDQIKTAFQPTQALVDPNAVDQFIGGANKPYIDSLLGISSALGSALANPAAANDPASFTQVQGAIANANTSVSVASQQFKVETKYNTASTVQALMKAPIDCVVKVLPSAGAPGAGGGKKICETVNPLLSKYPFAASPTAPPASIADVNAVFAPETGAVWTIYGATLKPFIVPVGAQYDKSPTAPAAVNPKFLAYFNKLAHISNTLYPAGTKSPAFDFNLRIKSQNGVTNATFVLDGTQRIPNGAISQKFHWDGATAQKASLVAGQNEVPFPGTWGLFQLVHAASKITRTATGYQLDYPLENSNNLTLAGHSVAQSGSAGSVSFEISGPGAEILMSDYFSGLNCPGPAVK
jgi:type VI secretion system protein ImpL